MKISAQDIILASVDAAIAELKKHDLPHAPHMLLPLFVNALKQRGNMVSAVLVTPSGDAGELTGRITEVLERTLARPVMLEQRADASMIGGAVLLIGNERIDLSVKGSLAAMAEGLR